MTSFEIENARSQLKAAEAKARSNGEHAVYKLVPVLDFLLARAEQEVPSILSSVETDDTVMMDAASDGTPLVNVGHYMLEPMGLRFQAGETVFYFSGVADGSWGIYVSQFEGHPLDTKVYPTLGEAVEAMDEWIRGS